MTYQNSSNNRDINQPVNTQSGTTYVALLSDTIIAMSNAAARQVTLPAPSTSGATSTVGKVYTVKDVAGTAATANITVTPAGGFIDGGTGVLIATNYGSASFYSDGTAWYSQAANYAAGVTLAIASFNRSGSASYTPGTTVVNQSVANYTTIGNSGSRLDLSSLTQNSLTGFTVTGSGKTLQFSQAGTYLISFDDLIQTTSGAAVDVTAQLVKNGTTVLANCVPFINSASVPTCNLTLNYLGSFTSTDTIDIRYTSPGSGGTYLWRSNNLSVTQLPSSTIPSLAGNTPTSNIITVTSGMSPYTYTPSANLQYAIVECVGGGGGGGGSSGTAGNASAAPGGGGGGYARSVLSASAIGASQTVTIGSAGTAGASTPTSGGNGGNTSFGALVIASGGTGGAGIGPQPTTPNSVQGAAAGIGTTGTFLCSGTPGGSALMMGTTAGGVAGGNGGSSVYGGGGRGKTGGSGAGFAGSNFGAGGGGACAAGNGTSSSAGGAGTAGVCVITEYIFAPPPLTTTASITWNTVSGTSQAMSASNGYYTTNGSATTLSLPTSGAAAGTVIEVVGTGAGLWTITQSSGQSIRFGNQTTTTGAGGSLAEQAVGDSISLVCITANTTWVAFASHGNLTVV